MLTSWHQLALDQMQCTEQMMWNDCGLTTQNFRKFGCCRERCNSERKKSTHVTWTTRRYLWFWIRQKMIDGDWSSWFLTALFQAWLAASWKRTFTCALTVSKYHRFYDRSEQMKQPSMTNHCPHHLSQIHDFLAVDFLIVMRWCRAACVCTVQLLLCSWNMCGAAASASPGRMQVWQSWMVSELWIIPPEGVAVLNDRTVRWRQEGNLRIGSFSQFLSAVSFCN